jgi:DNA-binding MltR family transcriptional regulator
MRRPKHEPIDDAEAMRFVRVWIRKSDAEAALLAGTFVEDRLGFAIKSQFVSLPTAGNNAKMVTEAALFDGYGPLATFFAKIDIGYALGLYDLMVRNDLHMIRSIRNDFAHSLESVSFSQEPVASKLTRLRILGSLNDLRGGETTIATFDKQFYLASCGWLSGLLTGVATGTIATKKVLQERKQ